MNTSKPNQRSVDGVAMASYSSGSQTPHGFRPPPRPLSTSTSSTPASALRKDRFIAHRSSDVSSLSHFLLTTEESITPLQLSQPPPRTSLTTPTLLQSPLMRGGSLGAGGGGGGSDGVLAQLVESHSTRAAYSSGASPYATPSPSPARSLFGASQAGGGGGGRHSSMMGSGGAAAARARPTTTFFSSSLPGGRGGIMSGRHTGVGVESSGRSLSGTLLSLLDASNRFDSEVGTDVGLDEDGDEIHSAVRPGKSLSLRRSGAGGGRGADRLSTFMGGGRATLGESVSRPSAEVAAAAAAYDRRESAGGSISSGMLLAGGSISAAAAASTTTTPASAVSSHSRPSSQHLLPSPRLSDAMFLDLEAEHGRESGYPTPTPVAHLSVEPYNARLARSLFSDAPQTSVLCHAPIPTEWGKGGSSSNGGGGGGKKRHTQGSRSSMCSSVSSCVSSVPLPTGARSTSRTASLTPPPSFTVGGGGGIPRGARLPSEGTVTPPFPPHDRRAGGRAPPSPPPLPPPPPPAFHTAPPERWEGRKALPTLDTAYEVAPLSSAISSDEDPLFRWSREPHHHASSSFPLLRSFPSPMVPLARDGHDDKEREPSSTGVDGADHRHHPHDVEEEEHSPMVQPPVGGITFTKALEDHYREGDEKGWCPSRHPLHLSASRGRESAAHSLLGSRSRSPSKGGGDFHRVSRGGRRKLPLRSTSGEGFTNRFAFGHGRAGEGEVEEEVGMEEEEGRGRQCVVLRGPPTSPHSLPSWSGRGEEGAIVGDAGEGADGAHRGPEEDRHRRSALLSPSLLSSSARRGQGEDESREGWYRSCTNQRSASFRDGGWQKSPFEQPQGSGEGEGEGEEEEEQRKELDLLLRHPLLSSSRAWRQSNQSRSGRKEWSRRRTNEEEEEDEEEEGNHEEEEEANARQTDLSLLSQSGSRRPVFQSLSRSRDGSGCRSSGSSSSSSDDEEAFPTSGHRSTVLSSSGAAAPLPPHLSTPPASLRLRQRRYLASLKLSGDRSAVHADPQSEMQYFNQRPAVVFEKNKAQHFVSRSFRYIPTTSVHVLDALNVVDEFYYNVLDCSSLGVLAVALGNAMYLWDWSTQKTVILPKQPDCISALRWAPEGERLASSDEVGDVIVWDAKHSKESAIFTAHRQRVCGLAWNVTGNILTSGSADRSIILHDIRTSTPALSLTNGHTGEICSLQWSLNDLYLASGADDDKLLVWDSRRLETPLHTFTQHTAAVKAISWHPSQPHLLVSGGGTKDETLRFWSVDTGECIKKIPTNSQVSGVRWHPNGVELASSHGYPDNQVTLWRYPSLSRIIDLHGHRRRILNMCLSAGGETVITVGSDEAIRFWACFPPATAEGGAPPA